MAYSEHFALEADHTRAIEARRDRRIITARACSTRGIIHLLADAAGRNPEAPCITHVEDDGLPVRRYDHAGFLTRVLSAAAVLRRRGVERGDRICIVSHNHVDTVVVHFAAWALGAVVVPVNVGEDDDRIRYILTHAHPRMVIVRPEYIERIRCILAAEKAAVEILLSGAPPQDPPSLEQEIDAAEPLPPDGLPGSPDDEALIVYTSGTTGAPKGVVLDQRNLIADAQAIAAWHGVDASQTMMCVLPIHHVNGIVVTLVTPLLVGASVVLLRRFHTRYFFSIVARERVTIVSVVPTLLQFLLAEGISMPDEARCLRHVICGAGPLTCELARRFEERHAVPIIHGYGLSETTCYSCFLPVDLPPALHRDWMLAFGHPSIGVALDVNEMDIQDEHGRSCAEQERGEIVIRGVTVMKHYARNPQANADAFRNGWFHSGDEGFHLSDTHGRRFYFITGRFKELIIRGGVNIAPLEIDEVVNRCPGVRAGVAVGFDNDWYGEEVGAYVVREKDDVTAEQVLEHCRLHLPFTKCPKVVVFGEEIPATSTGKYRRTAVRHLFTEWESVQFYSRR